MNNKTVNNNLERESLVKFAKSLRTDYTWDKRNVENLCNPEQTYLIDKQDYDDLVRLLEQSSSTASEEKFRLHNWRYTGGGNEWMCADCGQAWHPGMPEDGHCSAKPTVSDSRESDENV